jgi:hypothetical protein
MPSSDSDAVGDDSADQSRWQRFTLSVSHMMLKPAVAAETRTGEDRPKDAEPTTIPELEVAIKRANDKERIIGLVAAPIAAAIVFVVMATLVHNDPSKYLANGTLNPHYTNPNLYTELGMVTLALALVMLGGAWFRKRLVIGVASALYGLSFFNLHYWGFGLPYIMIGAWYMVRAYRLSQKLKMAKAADAPTFGPSGVQAPPNKRYTPPSTPARRTPKSKPAKGTEAG